jgi:hypothetical protein
MFPLKASGGPVFPGLRSLDNDKAKANKARCQ